MNVNLYNNSDDNRKLTKDPSFVETVTCGVTNTISITNPVLILNTARHDFNYIQIPSFENRYYFVNDIEILTGGRVRVSCSVDVLYSAKDIILNAPCLVVRSGNGLTDITDNKLPVPKVNFIESHFLTDVDYPENNYLYAVTVFGGE